MWISTDQNGYSDTDKVTDKILMMHVILCESNHQIIFIEFW